MNKQSQSKTLLPNNLMTTGMRWTSKQTKSKDQDRHLLIFAMTKISTVLIVPKTL